MSILVFFADFCGLFFTALFHVLRPNGSLGAAVLEVVARGPSLIHALKTKCNPARRHR